MKQGQRKVYKRFSGPVRNVAPDLERQFFSLVDENLPMEVDGFRLSTDRVLVSTSQDALIMQFWTEEKLENGDPVLLGAVTASGLEIEAERDMVAFVKARVDAALSQARGRG